MTTASDETVSPTHVCTRHPGVSAEYGFTSHYIANNRWQDVVRAEQSFGPFCAECRLEFVRWATHRADQSTSEVQS